MHPNQRNQVPYIPMYHPTVPPQVRNNPPRQPAAYESWPWDGGSHGYHYPVQCHGHGCCNHNYFPGQFMMRPPYPQVAPPYFHGYPAAPGACSFQYFPPHYAMEFPPYEFNKDMPGEHHCCGCPNHPHSRKEGKSIKIEEIEPDQAETKGDQSLFPWEFKNYPYPIVWLPPGCMKSKEKIRPDDLEHEGRNRSSRGTEANGNLKSFEEQPTAWNGWFPFHPNKLGSLKQGEDHKRSQHNQDTEAHENSKSSEVQPSAWNGWFPFDATNLGSLKHGEDHRRGQHNRDGKGHENSKSLEEQPMTWNGWFPFDFNKLQPLKQGEDPKRSQCNQDNKQGSSPFPLFWMPYKPEVTTERKEPKEASLQQGPPSHLESTSEKLDKTEAKCEGDIKDEGAKSADKNTVQKTNPVKQVEPDEEKKTSESIGEKNGVNTIRKTIPVKQVEPNEEKKTSESIAGKNGAKKSLEDGAKRQSSSPQKSSKLPAVCLRVEPLPKKKGINGHSRSPSPPGDKGKSNDSSGKQSVPTKSPTAKECAKQNVPAADNKAVRSKEQEHNKSKLKCIYVSEGTIQEGSREFESARSHSSSPEATTAQMQKNLDEGDAGKADSDVKEKLSEECSEPDKATTEMQSSGAREIPEPKETFANTAERSRRTLSEDEAAMIIQSAFRGFEVRKWEPLKKLKQIAKIKEQIGEIRNRIQALESSSETCNNDNQRTIITEMIMCLLLQLDAIQGVHPSIRDIRKSVAKELVSLQETLDLLISESLEKSLEQLSGTSSEEMKEELGSQRENHGDNIGDECNLLTTERETESLSVESCHEQPHCTTDVASDTKDAEISESMVANGNLDEEIKNISGIGPERGLEPVTGLEAGENNKEIGDSSLTEAPHDHEEGFKQPFESQQIGGETTNATETTNSTSTGRDKDAEELAELQQGALDVCIDSELSSEKEKIEPTANEVSEDKVTNNISVVPEHDEVKDLNRTGPLQEEGQKEPAMSDLEDKLGDEKQEIPITEVLGETLSELHEIPLQVQGEQIGADAPVEFPKAETEAGFGNAAEALKVEGADSSGGSNPTNGEEVSNIEEPAEASILEEPTAAEALGELSAGNNDVQDESHDHEAINANFLLGSEDTKDVSAACEAPVELSKEHEAEGNKNYVAEGFEGQDINPVAGDSEVTGDNIVSVSDRQVESGREESVPAIARTVEAVDVESTTGNNEVAAQPCGSATAEHEDVDRVEYVDTNTKQGDEGDFSPPSPTASQVSHLSDTLTESDRRLIEEREKLREMMERLIEAGNKQLNTISSLSGRIKDLEKRLNRKKKLKIKRPRTSTSGSSCLKTKNGSLEERPLGLAM